MAYYCFKCGSDLGLSSSKAGRRETCSKCNTDVHVCLNCKHHDIAAYNQCREPQAERVVDKDRSNFCDYFSLIEGPHGAAPKKDDAMKRLDDLFKK